MTITLSSIDAALLKVTDDIKRVDLMLDEVALTLDNAAKVSLPELTDSAVARLCLVDMSLFEAIKPYANTRKYLGIFKTTKYKRDLLMARNAIKEQLIKYSAQDIEAGIKSRKYLGASQEWLLELKHAIQNNLDTTLVLEKEPK